MRFIIAASTMGLLASAAGAQEAQSFTMEKTPDGYVRLDNSTGQMSICKESGTQLVCRIAADDRSAFEDEVGRLQDKVDALEKRVAALETGGGSSSTGLPTEQEFDKTMSYMQRFFQGFVDIVKGLDKDLRDPQTPQGPVPDRT